MLVLCIQVSSQGHDITITGHLGLFRYETNQPPKVNSAFHPSGLGKWVPAPAVKVKAGMVHSVSGWTRGVQVKLCDLLRMRAIPERLRGVFTTRRYTNPRLPYVTLPPPSTTPISGFYFCFIANNLRPSLVTSLSQRYRSDISSSKPPLYSNKYQISYII